MLNNHLNFNTPEEGRAKIKELRELQSLIEAKKSNGKLLSRISYRTDFDDIDECRIFRKYYLKELNNLSYSDKRRLASERTNS